jgi:hypothetical protein
MDLSKSCISNILYFLTPDNYYNFSRVCEPFYNEFMRYCNQLEQFYKNNTSNYLILGSNYVNHIRQYPTHYCKYESYYDVLNILPNLQVFIKKPNNFLENITNNKLRVLRLRDHLRNSSMMFGQMGIGGTRPWLGMGYYEDSGRIYFYKYRFECSPSNFSDGIHNGYCIIEINTMYQFLTNNNKQSILYGIDKSKFNLLPNDVWILKN